jgi:hypothetical protein
LLSSTHFWTFANGTFANWRKAYLAKLQRLNISLTHSNPHDVTCYFFCKFFCLMHFSVLLLVEALKVNFEKIIWIPFNASNKNFRVSGGLFQDIYASLSPISLLKWLIRFSETIADPFDILFHVHVLYNCNTDSCKTTNNY